VTALLDGVIDGAAEPESLAVGLGDEVREVIIIGSGPAGYTAAIYAARAGLRPLVVEGVAFGGALMTTNQVENYPGFADPVTGPELIDAMRKQAGRYGAELVTADATRVGLTSPIKTVTTDGTWYRTRAVILATGSTYRTLGLAGEQRLRGHGVSYCAACDGFFFRGQDVAVVGGGDAAMEEAAFLARFATSVTVIHRRGSLRASKIMQDRAFADPKIRFVWDTVVTDVLGGDRVTGLALRHRPTGVTSTLPVAGVFVAIGHDPNSALFAGQVAVDATGHVVVDHPTTRTSLPGVFAAGDLVDRRYQQAVTAAGTGAAAALDADRWLATHT